MRVRLTLGWLVVLGLLAAIAEAQQPAAAQAPARSLSLAEAQDIARRSNPDYLTAANDRGPAAWQLRTATLNLFTPDAGLRGSHSFTASGTRSDFFGQPTASQASTTQSYSFGLSYDFSGQTLASRGQARAGLRVAESGIAEARTRLETEIRRLYLNALQAQAEQELARRSLERARENHALAQARYSVGQGNLIEVRQNEVQQGQREVAVLRADQSADNELLRLFQQIGTPKPAGPVVLTDSFPVAQPMWTLEQLLPLALSDNPGLLSLRAREHSATWSSRAARSEFLPTFSLNVGVMSGSRLRTEIDTAAGSGAPLLPVTQSNRNPWGFTVSASLPIYDGFARNSRVAQARAQEDDARQAVRARELQLRTDVTAALHAVQAAWQSIDIQRRNREASSEALELATQRYRVGSGGYLELLSARVDAEQAARDHVAAVYDYHRAIAALENAVGRPLR